MKLLVEVDVEGLTPSEVAIAVLDVAGGLMEFGGTRWPSGLVGMAQPVRLLDRRVGHWRIVLQGGK